MKKTPKTTRRTPPPKPKRARPTSSWELKLYIAGHTPRSLAAFSNLKRICEENLKEHYHIEVIDLAKHPELARADQILALPTLVRKLPPPVKKIIGDLSNKEKVLVGFDFKQGFE